MLHLELVGDADVIVDCMDNFPTRFLLNRAAVTKGVPFVYGSIWGMEGQITVIVPGETPCLMCIFPEAPPAEVFPVLGSTPGVVGSIQATEVLKYLTGIGSLLTGMSRLLASETTRFHGISTGLNLVLIPWLLFPEPDFQKEGEKWLSKLEYQYL